jgi:hypothetical protein
VAGARWARGRARRHVLAGRDGARTRSLNLSRERLGRLGRNARRPRRLDLADTFRLLDALLALSSRMLCHLDLMEPPRTTTRSPECTAGRAGCAACDDRAVVEYGNGIGQVAGQAGGGSGGGPVDAGAGVGQLVANATQTLSTMPPAVLVVGAIALVFLALIILRRAF